MEQGVPPGVALTALCLGPSGGTQPALTFSLSLPAAVPK